ncbi:MAG: hypothetical protein KDI59_05675 [Xanthomonadales bacterium]|jgi:hypothetical protein|nr:hypothetical protein [Xanthomonadales bacterium]
MKKLLVFFLLFANHVYSAVINMGPNGCTLQDAIRSANNDSSVGNCSSGSGTDTIIAPDGWSITLSSRLPTITTDMTIRSETLADLLYISGDNSTAIMKVTGANTDLILERVKLYDGSKGSAIEGGGAAIEIDDANVVINYGILDSNRVRNAKGGAININNGQLTTNFTRFTYNTAVPPTGGGTISYPSIGGAVYSNQSILNFNATEFSDNNASNAGSYPVEGDTLFAEGGELNITDSLINGTIGGIAGKTVTTTITNSTFGRGYPSYLNYAKLYLYNNSSLTMNHVTMDAVMSLHDTTAVVSNSAFDHYLVNYQSCIFDNSPLVVDTHNITKNFDCPGSEDFVYGTLYLEALADNGGFTRTMKIGSLDSPLIDSGNPAYCLPTDQRGESRGAECDAGAYELNDIADVRVELEITQNPPYVSGQEIHANIVVTNDGPGAANAIQVDYSSSRFFIQSVNSALCSQLPCTLNQIASGQQVEIPIIATLGNYTQSTFDVTVEAHSTASSNHDDPDEYQPGENNEFTANGNINPGVDISVDMNLLTAPPYFVDQIITYEAVVTNHGQDQATNIDFELTLDGTSLVQFSGCDSVNQNHCYINQILNQGDRTIDISVKVTGSLFNAEATVSASQIDIDLSNNTDDQGNQGAVEDTDVSISMLANQSAPYYSYQYISFDVTVKTGDKPASNVKVWVDVPGADWIGMSGCGSIPCGIATMTAFDSITMTAEMFAPIIPNNGQHYNWQPNVYVEPAQTDSDLSNNQDTKVIQILPVADMYVSVDLITEPPYYAGQEVTYEVTAINGGLNRATQINLTPDITNLTLQWLAGNQCSDINCQIAQMDFAQREEMTLQFVIDQPGDFNLGYSISASEYDSNTSNNNDLLNGDTALEPPNDIVFEDGFE